MSQIHQNVGMISYKIVQYFQPKIQPAFAGLIFGRARIGQSNAVAHDQYENTQLEKSQKSQEQDFCRFLLLRIEVSCAFQRAKK